jgi:hypothetical protein
MLGYLSLPALTEKHFVSLEGLQARSATVSAHMHVITLRSRSSISYVYIAWALYLFNKRVYMPIRWYGKI